MFGVWMNVVLPSVRFKEPRHAVAVARVPKGSKRHTLLADVAQEEEFDVML